MLISEHSQNPPSQSQYFKSCLIQYLRGGGGSALGESSYSYDTSKDNFLCPPWYQQLQAVDWNVFPYARVFRLINDYEAWMQDPLPSDPPEQLAQAVCEFCKDSHKLVGEDICAYCTNNGMVGGSKKLGQEIIERNAGHTMFLTERGFHFQGRLAIEEGDIICNLWLGCSHFILRKADEENWTLVGRFVHEHYEVSEKFENTSRYPGEPEAFRLR